MNKKRKTYLLLVLVAGIWSVIGYKVYTAINPSDDEIVKEQISIANFKTTPLKERDTFSIKADYRDPFLGTFPKKKNTTQLKKASNKTVAKPTIAITYSGWIKNTNSKDHVYFVSIGGIEQLMKQGQTIQEVTLLRGSSKNIQIRYKGVKSTIPLQQQ